MAKSVVKIPVVVDTREKREWEFAPESFTIEKATLVTGDYTLSGLEEVLCLERKNLGDFVSSVTHEWLTHRKRWYRMAGFDLAAVVVEANIEDVLAHRYESETSPASVLGRANAIFIDHNLPVFFWGSRANCRVMVEMFFAQAWKKLRHLQ